MRKAKGVNSMKVTLEKNKLMFEHTINNFNPVLQLGKKQYEIDGLANLTKAEKYITRNDISDGLFEVIKHPYKSNGANKKEQVPCIILSTINGRDILELSYVDGVIYAKLEKGVK
ncbi:MAG: hypothetical protein ACRCX2_13925 [Paraclostridium sp.]